MTGLTFHFEPRIGCGLAGSVRGYALEHPTVFHGQFLDLQRPILGHKVPAIGPYQFFEWDSSYTKLTRRRIHRKQRFSDQTRNVLEQSFQTNGRWWVCFYLLPGKVVTSTVFLNHLTEGSGRPRARHGNDEILPKSPSVSKPTLSTSIGFSISKKKKKTNPG